MRNGLNSLYYIRNNRRKVITLVIIFTLFITMIYGVNFFLDPVTGVEENTVEARKKTQVITIGGLEDLNMDEAMAEYNKLYKALNKRDDIEALKAEMSSFDISSIIGTFTKEIPFLRKDDMTKYLEKMGAVLVEGEMPKKSDEIVADRKVLNNLGIYIGDSIGDIQMNHYKVVGVIESDYYLAVGLNDRKNSNYFSMVTFSDGEAVNLREICKSTGTKLKLYYNDMTEANEMLNATRDQVDPSIQLITIVSTVLIAICLIIFMSMSFRDRYDEWCLYRSIGFSSGQIYMSVIREIGIIVLISAVMSVVLLTGLITLISSFVFDPSGYVYSVFYPDTIFNIVCILVFVLGILQLPLAVAMRRVRTIDAIEEDVY